MVNLYADVDARSMTPSRNTRSYTIRSVPSSPGRSFFSSMQHAFKPQSLPDRLCHASSRNWAFLTCSRSSPDNSDTTICCVAARTSWLSRQHSELLSTDSFPSATLIYEFLSTFVVYVPSLLYNYGVHHNPFLAE